LPPAVRVVTGRRTTCIVDRDGRAWCWGRGDEGVRGDGTTETIGDDEPLEAALRPVALGPRRVRDLDLGRDHACALLDDMSIRCWGDGARGQLGVAGWRRRIGDGIGDGRGRGERPDAPALAPTGLEDVKVKDVAAAGDRSCVVTEAGGVRCWGDDEDGALGYAPDTVPGCDDPKACIVDTPGSAIDFGGRPIERVALSLDHACAIDDTGGVHCWGLQIWGRVGDGLARPGPASELDMTAVAVLPIRIDLGDGDGDGESDRARALAMGDQHSCALVHTGGIRCWGYGSNGALGYASTDTVGDNETPAEYYARIGVADVPVF
jgi:alpha-tubulin suppressor-like RCC1 family protein